MHIQFSASVVPSEAPHPQREGPVEEQIPKETVGLPRRKDEPTRLTDGGRVLIESFAEIKYHWVGGQPIHDEVFNLPKTSQSLGLLRHQHKVRKVLGDSLTRDFSSHAGNADNQKDVGQVLGLLLPQGAVDFVGSEGEAVRGIQSNEFSSFPEQRAMELDINSEYLAATAIEDQVSVSPRALRSSWSRSSEVPRWLRYRSSKACSARRPMRS